MVKVNLLLVYDEETDQFLMSTVPFYGTYHWDYDSVMKGCDKYPLRVNDWYDIDKDAGWSVKIGNPVKIAELWFDIFLYNVYLSTIDSRKNMPPVPYGNCFVHWSKQCDQLSRESGDNINESNMFSSIARAYVFKEG